MTFDFLAPSFHETVSDMKEDVLGPSYAINKIKVGVEKLSSGINQNNKNPSLSGFQKRIVFCLAF